MVIFGFVYFVAIGVKWTNTICCCKYSNIRHPAKSGKICRKNEQSQLLLVGRYSEELSFSSSQTFYSILLLSSTKHINNFTK